MHIVSLKDGQVLRTRTITRLIRENQFSLEEFKKFKVATHETSVQHQEDSYDQMLFKKLVQELLLKQKNQVTLEKVGTHHRCSHKVCSSFGVEKVKIVNKNHAAMQEAHCSDQRLARLHQQVGSQHQGQICVINFEAIQDQQDS